MKILVRGVNHERFESCAFSLYVVVLGQVTRYSNDTASFLPQPTILAEANIPSSLVIPLLNAALRQSVPSQITFSITSGFVATYYNQQCNFLAEWPLKLVHEVSLSSARRTI